MINYKEKFKKQLESEIESTVKHIKYLDDQIKTNLPKAINECYLKISNLKELLKSVENNDSFSDPIFSYINNEDDEYGYPSDD
jgi:hypothetical protein